jgi:hypothetical protein
VTLRRRVLRRNTGVGEALGINVELWSASYLSGFWREPGMATRRWWQRLAAVHGERIEAKVRRWCPGTRPGWWYAVGRLPPVPLLEGEPGSETGWWRRHLDIEGVRYWRLGEGWQVSQAEHLRTLGELDGEELRRYRSWRRRGYPQEYCTDKFPERPGVWFFHGCY